MKLNQTEFCDYQNDGIGDAVENFINKILIIPNVEIPLKNGYVLEMTVGGQTWASRGGWVRQASEKLWEMALEAHFDEYDPDSDSNDVQESAKRVAMEKLTSLIDQPN